MEKFLTAAFEDSLPYALRNDETIYRYGSAFGEALRDVNGDIESVLIWARIDELDESILDVLASALHVDWWNQATSVDAKRATLKAARQVHMKLGTPSAIVQALESLTDCSAEINEWFDYQGDPGWFRITVTFDEANPDYFSSDQESAWSEVLTVVARTKRLSQWLDGITVEMPEMDADAIPVNPTPVCTWLSTCLPYWDETVIGNFILDEDVLDADSV